MIKYGPFAGIEGSVIRAPHGKVRIVVSIESMQRSVAAEMDADCLGLTHKAAA